MRDIHSPAPIGWWPPAPGWWVIATLALLALIWLTRMIVQRYQRARYRRQTRALLSNIWEAYTHSRDSTRFARELLTALRRCAISAGNGHTIRTLPTDTLLTAVNEHSGGELLSVIPMPALTSTLYNPDAQPLTAAQAQALHDSAVRWVARGARLPC